MPLVYVNACGMQNNGKNVMVFDGDSTIYDEQGERQLSLNDQFEPECGSSACMSAKFLHASRKPS